jgi:UDP-glucuronate 4-epimerase
MTENTAPRRILVTGAAGFVGSHVCDALLRDGHEVVGLDAFIDSYERSRKESNLERARRHPRFRLVEADLASDDLAPHLQDVDVVVNEAAIAGLPRSWSDIDSYARHNVVGLQRLLEAARRADVQRVVHASTSSVYGRNATCDETGVTRPVSPYGATKLAGEHLIHAYLDDFDLPVVILRYFSIYGPRQRPDMAYQIFAERLLRGEPITVFGDGLQSRSNTFVDDCVAATLLAVDRARVGETYNVGGGAVTTLAEAIEVLADLLGVAPRIERAPERPGDQRHTAADISKAQRDLGYEPVVAPRDGLRAQADWNRERLGVAPLAGA